MFKNLLIFVIGMVTYFLIGGVTLYFSGNTPAEWISLWLEKIF